MDVGVLIPQGWTGEYDGWDAAKAWKRTVWLAQQADDLGFESIWLFDHFHTVPVPTDEITFEAFTGLSALAALTTRARLGHMVTCAGYRNPALVAKMIATMDVISGGRIDFGVGAGWKEDEWRAYGYGFPSLRERQTRLRDALEISRQMLRQPDRARPRAPRLPAVVLARPALRDQHPDVHRFSSPSRSSTRDAGSQSSAGRSRPGTRPARAAAAGRSSAGMCSRCPCSGAAGSCGTRPG